MKPFQDIPFSVLDLAPIVEGGTARDALHASRDLARYAEKLDFYRYWVAEHHNMPGIASAATSVVIGFLAESTSRLRVGAGGIMLLNHSPLVIAEQFGTLETLYRGRIDLGLGRAPGSDQATMRAVRDGLSGTGEEFPQKLEELRSYFDHPLAGQRIHAYPGQGLHIPIWLLGSGGFSAQLAGNLGLPFASAAHFSPDNLLSGLELYRRGFRASSSLERPQAMVCINVFAADTEDEAWRLASSQFQAHLALVRGRPIALPRPLESIQEIKTTDLPFLKGSLIGTADQIKEQLGALVEATSADEIMVHSMIHDPEARMHSYEILQSVIR